MLCRALTSAGAPGKPASSLRLGCVLAAGRSAGLSGRRGKPCPALPLLQIACLTNVRRCFCRRPEAAGSALRYQASPTCSRLGCCGYCKCPAALCACVHSCRNCLPRVIDDNLMIHDAHGIVAQPSRQTLVTCPQRVGRRGACAVAHGRRQSGGRNAHQHRLRGRLPAVRVHHRTPAANPIPIVNVHMECRCHDGVLILCVAQPATAVSERAIKCSQGPAEAVRPICPVSSCACSVSRSGQPIASDPGGARGMVGWHIV